MWARVLLGNPPQTQDPSFRSGNGMEALSLWDLKEETQKIAEDELVFLTAVDWKSLYNYFS